MFCPARNGGQLLIDGPPNRSIVRKTDEAAEGGFGIAVRNNAGLGFDSEEIGYEL